MIIPVSICLKEQVSLSCVSVCLTVTNANVLSLSPSSVHLQVVQKDEAESELAKTTMGLFVLHEKQSPLCEPVEIGIIIDGVEVLSELSSVASACAMLFGLIYSLDLKYPDELKYSFETFQKIVMDIESRKMSKRVQNLAAKLQDLV